MQELIWYAISHGVTRPVPIQDIPLWFAAVLLFGLLCAGLLIGAGMMEWFGTLHRRGVRANRPALARQGHHR
jgi:hypothetical protein